MNTSARAGVQAFEFRGRSLYARDIVGVIALSSVVVEILPKVNDTSTADDATGFLVDLLQFTSPHTRLSISEAFLAIGKKSLLEVILAWAVRTAIYNIRLSLPRRYVSREEISTAVRGRIDLHDVASARPGRKFALLVRYAPLSSDNNVTRMIRWLLIRILRSTRVTATKSQCHRALEYLPQVADISPHASDFDRIVLQPLEEHWSPLLRLAQALVKNAPPDPTRSGSLGSIAVLFTLHDLFEAALRRIFREQLPKASISLHPARRYLLLPKPSDGRPSIMQLRPDFGFFSPSGDLLVIGDAKWKRILEINGDLTLTTQDIYQLTTYITAFRASSGLLLCPLFGNNEGPAMQISSWQLAGEPLSVQIIGVHTPKLIEPTSNGQALRKEFCDLVTSLIKPEAVHSTVA